MQNLEARLTRLEEAAPVVADNPPTDADALEFVRQALRERRIIYTGDSWAPNPATAGGDDWSWLAALPADDWRILESLARRHTSGHLSASAWATASSAIVGNAFLRASEDGRITFQDAA